MDPDAIFKRFFGTSFPDIGHPPFRPVGDEDGNKRPGEFHRETEADLFGDLHVRIHQHMEEMDKQMQEAFRIFSIPGHMPSDVPSLPGEASEGDPQAGSSARDQMLKEGERSSCPPGSSERPSQRSFGDFFSPWIEGFMGTPGLNRIPSGERRDCDIDSEKPNEEDIVDLYSRARDSQARDPQKRESQRRDPFSSFFGGSVSIQTVVGADGVVEERRTVQNSDGHEETTVTRRMGDQVHTVTTIRDGTGQEEKREIFQNIDKDRMSEFDKKWQGTGQYTDPRVPDPNTAVTLPSVPGGRLSDNRGFFRKLFGF